MPSNFMFSGHLERINELLKFEMLLKYLRVVGFCDSILNFKNVEISSLIKFDVFFELVEKIHYNGGQIFFVLGQEMLN